MLRTWNILDIISDTDVKIPALKEDDDLDIETTRNQVLLAMGRNFSKAFGDRDCVAIDNLRVELITPIAMEKGMRFAVREGGRTVGAGLITEITE